MARNPYSEPIVDSLCGDIKKARDNGIFAGAIILVLSAIDAMAFLSMPLEQREVHRRDYVDWVNKYLKADTKQPYQYEGVDLYGARCAIVHRYGHKSRLSESGKCKVFFYHNGSEHIYNPRKEPSVVGISRNRLINDFFKAVANFLHDIGQDDDLKARVDSRIEELFIISKKEKSD